MAPEREPAFQRERGHPKHPYGWDVEVPLTASSLKCPCSGVAGALSRSSSAPHSQEHQATNLGKKLAAEK